MNAGWTNHVPLFRDLDKPAPPMSESERAEYLQSAAAGLPLLLSRMEERNMKAVIFLDISGLYRLPDWPILKRRCRSSVTMSSRCIFTLPRSEVAG